MCLEQLVRKSPSLTISRRDVVNAFAAGAMLLPAVGRAATTDRRPVDAIAFDGFPIFDPRSVGAMVQSLIPDRGGALAQAWSNKLFGYTWLYTSADRYVSFDVVADEALRFSADALGLALSAAARGKLVGAYSQLNIWPDVKPRRGSTAHQHGPERNRFRFRPCPEHGSGAEVQASPGSLCDGNRRL